MSRMFSKRRGAPSRDAGGAWFLGFVAALIYYLHTHSGSFWLVVVALVKALLWPGFLVYHLLALHA